MCCSDAFEALGQSHAIITLLGIVNLPLMLLVKEF